MTRRWRPSLAFVLGGALAGTLALSFAGLVALRYLGPAIGFRHAAILLAVAITLATALVGWLLVRLLLRPILALKAIPHGQTPETSSSTACGPPTTSSSLHPSATTRRSAGSRWSQTPGSA